MVAKAALQAIARMADIHVEPADADLPNLDYEETVFITANPADYEKRS